MHLNLKKIDSTSFLLEGLLSYSHFLGLFLQSCLSQVRIAYLGSLLLAKYGALVKGPHCLCTRVSVTRTLGLVRAAIIENLKSLVGTYLIF